MQKRAYLLFRLLTLTLLFSSCNLSFLVSKKQAVSIQTKSENKILINKKEPEMDKGKILLPRNGEPQQITVKREGYKNEYKVCVPYKIGEAGLYNYLGNALLFGIPTAALGTPSAGLFVGGICALLGGDNNKRDKKCWDYESEIMVGNELLKTPQRDTTMKHIQISDISFNVKPEKAKENVVLFENYLNKSMRNSNRGIIKESNIESNSPYLTSNFNTILSKSGFIDTTGNILTKGYKNNMFLEATIIGYSANYILPKFMFLKGQVLGFMNIELDIKWDLLDLYKNKVYTDTLKSTSGEFVVYDETANSTYIQDAIIDAAEIGLYSFIEKPNFQKNLKYGIGSEQDAKSDSVLNIVNSKVFVSDIEQAVGSSLTVKTKNGHGSGFIISEDGYLITNYHVVAGSSSLEIILNNGDKHSVKIVRENKDYDLALLKIDTHGLLPFKISDSETISVGTDIYAIGTPSAVDLNQTLSKGIISSIRKGADGQRLIQTDASINAGNSGGPMIDKEGNLIGVVSSKIIGKGVEGIAFAIPSYEILKKLNVKFK